jgi:hypothetical protein
MSFREYQYLRNWLDIIHLRLGVPTLVGKSLTEKHRA